MSEEARIAEPSADQRRQAAVWIARLHAPDRSARIENGFRRWLSESPQHRAAFETANEIWEGATRLPEYLRPAAARASAGGWRTWHLAAAAALIVAVGIGSTAMLHDDALVTAVGEQRILTLEDGTRISLNTATRVVVDYDRQRRHVTLLSGEALFEVAPRPSWPFVVTAGEQRITALGTSFIVRREGRELAVILMEGKVAVAPALPETAAPPRTLRPGDRVTFAADRHSVSDRPSLEKVAAWRRGLVALDRTPLNEAIAEMNRYSQVQLSLEDARAADVRISGVFRAGDSLFFAQAIAETYHLEVSQRSRKIVLSGQPTL